MKAIVCCHCKVCVPCNYLSFKTSQKRQGSRIKFLVKTVYSHLSNNYNNAFFNNNVQSTTYIAPLMIIPWEDTELYTLGKFEIWTANGIPPLGLSVGILPQNTSEIQVLRNVNSAILRTRQDVIIPWDVFY